MLKIPKENVKYFFLLTVGLAVLVFISILSDVNYVHKNLFHKPEPDMTKYINTRESTVEETKYERSTEARRLLYYTDEIMEMINNKEYDILYSILDEGYRNLYVKTLEDLKEDLSKFADAEYTMSYDKYYKEDNMFLVDVRFEKHNLTRDEIVNGVSTPIDTLCIREIEKGKYTVAFNGFISRQTFDKVISNGLVNIHLKEMTLTANSTEILVHIYNPNEEKVILYDTKLDVNLLHKLADYKYIRLDSLEKEVEPKNTLIRRLSFPNIYSKGSKPLELRFKRIHLENGEPQKITFDFD